MNTKNKDTENTRRSQPITTERQDESKNVINNERPIKDVNNRFPEDITSRNELINANSGNHSIGGDSSEYAGDDMIDLEDEDETLRGL